MTRTNKNRLLAGLLIVIPLGSYYYFLTEFLSDKSIADEQDGSMKHRYRIDQFQSIPAQTDQLVNDKRVN
ncbi:MAG: hypothetical protein V3V22_05295 [Methylococcales bacterium]